MLHKKILPVVLLSLIFYRLPAQVNLQTGSATFSLPMFSWQDDKSRLSSIVALSYNSGNGLKVNEIASNAGQGWNLIAGGEIVRMQAGEPDDQVARTGSGYWDVTKYPPGILYATVPATNGCPVALTKYPIYGWQNQMYAQHNTIAEDKQLDYFSFQFNGKAGMFVLDPSNLGTAKSIGDSKMIITFQQDANLINSGIRTKITSFTIKDDDGLIYKFALHGLSKVMKTEHCDDTYNYKQTQPKFKNGKVYYQSAFDDGTLVNPWIINNWYLTEIEDALTQRKIYFNYTNARNINNTAGEDISAYYANKEYCIVSHKISKTQSRDISSIVYPDGHAVTLNYKTNERIDLIGSYAISSVDITYNSRPLSKYLLNTSYFIRNRYGSPVSDYERRVARLCLKSVQKIGVDLKEDTPPYIFDYYTGSSASDDFVPPPFFHMKDIWGFYNGSNSQGYYGESLTLTDYITDIKNANHLRGLCFRRDGVSGVYLNAKPGYAKNGLLRQIVYPTGGTLTYAYDQNTGTLNSNTINTGGVHVSQTSSTDGGYSNGCATPIVTNYSYTLNGSSTSSLWGLEMPNNKMEPVNHYQPEWKSWHLTWSSLPFGECYWHFQHPGIQSKQQAVDLAGWQKWMQAAAPVLGLLSLWGTINDIISVLNNGNPVSLIIDIISGLANLALTCIGNQERDTYATIYLNSDMNASAPLPVQFKRVEVVEGSGSIGKTVQEFTSDDDYAIWEPTNTLYSAKQRFAPWAYGLPKRTVVYDVNGYPIKETINYYSYTDVSCATPCPPKAKRPLNLFSTKCFVKYSASQRNTQWEDPGVYNAPGSYLTSSSTQLGVETYNVYGGRVELDTTVERVYKPNSYTYAETKTEYQYNSGTGNQNYEPNTITTYQSNGDINYKFIKYSSNYSGGVISTLLQNNIISQPVATSSAVYKYGGSGTYFLDEKVTEFTQLSNGDIKPLRILEQRFSQPKSTSNYSAYGGPGSSTSNYKVPQTFTYDGSGNLTGVKDEGGRTVTSIYDYDDKYAVAVVINAETGVDKTAYTSFETTSTGGWTLSGAAAYSTGTSMTGASSFVLSSGKSFTGSSLNTARPYIVSFWSTSSGITVTGGATLTKSAPTINGFTYYEYDIAQGTSSVSVAGSGTIDELRLYPKTARMRTSTYDPLIGKTSACDENNRIAYYEYDNLGRLRFEKDENKNVVQMYEYNNVSAAKQNGCPGTYYNRLISQVVVRNNCSSGQQGSQVIYTIAANTYSSTISQEDADAQAEAAILANAQGYANTYGTCQTIYYNAQLSVTDTTKSCPPGYVGGAVTYTVPAGRYISLISQADADEKAQDDMEANLQAYINNPPNAVCNYSSSPQWVWLEGGDTLCQVVGSEGHLFIKQTDINPNSSTYGQTRWFDTGYSANCPGPTCNPVTCTGAYKCINDVCELGVRVNTNSYPDPNMYPFWICVYHYEWSDGSWSDDYYESNPDPCALY